MVMVVVAFVVGVVVGVFKDNIMAMVKGEVSSGGDVPPAPPAA